MHSKTCSRLPGQLARFLALLLLVWLLAELPTWAGPPAAKNPLLALLPSEAGEVVFINAEQLRESPHYSDVKALLLPQSFHQFERYLTWAGVDLNRDVQRLLLSFTAQPEAADELVGIAEGDFHAERSRRFFEQQSLPLVEYDGVTIFPFGSGTERQQLVFTILDDSTAAFGTLASVERLLDIRRNRRPGLERNETLLRAIKEVNGKANMWIVMNREFTRRGLGLLVPTTTTLSDFRQVMGRIDTSTVQLEVSRGLESLFALQCRTAVDSYLFSAVMQVALWSERLKYKEKRPELATMIQNTTVNALGSRLEVATRADEKTLTKVLQDRLAQANR